MQRSDSGTYRANKIQAWLWERWGLFWQEVQQLKEERSATLYTVVNGDAVDANRHSALQLVDTDPNVIIDTGVEVFYPIRNASDYMFIVRGTEAHVGGNGWLEEQLAKELGTEKDTLTGRSSWWWLPLSVDGVTFDISHHPGTNSMRPWTRGGAANRIAAMAICDYAASGDQMPDYVIRSHVHHFEDSGLNFPPTRAITTPCWQLATAFTYRIGKGSQVPSVGGLIFMIEDGEHEFKYRHWEPKRRQPWSAQKQNSQQTRSAPFLKKLFR